MPNKWTDWVRKWADDHKMTYPCAIKDPACKAGYTKVPKPIMNRNIYGNPDETRKKRASIADPANANKTSTEKRHEWEDKNDPEGAEARKAFRDARDAKREEKRTAPIIAKAIADKKAKIDDAFLFLKNKAKEAKAKLDKAIEDAKSPAEKASDAEKARLKLAVEDAKYQLSGGWKSFKDVKDIAKRVKERYEKTNEVIRHIADGKSGSDAIPESYKNIFEIQRVANPVDDRPYRRRPVGEEWYNPSSGKTGRTMRWTGGERVGDNGWFYPDISYKSAYNKIPKPYITAYKNKDEPEMINIIRSNWFRGGARFGWNGSISNTGGGVE